MRFLRAGMIQCCLLVAAAGQTQPGFHDKHVFTEADTLRGMLRPERTCYDVTFYDLNIRVSPEKRFIEGFVDIHFLVKEPFSTLQIDLYDNMRIDRIEFQGRELRYRRRHHAVFVDFPAQRAGQRGVFRVYYDGMPAEAANPPWDGGFVWNSDEEGQPWIGVACEGDGASLWWPNKDHLSDEPDSMSIRIAVPKPLMCVANGNLREIIDLGDFQRYDWFVSYPINNYNVTVNIARYAHFSDTYTALDGDTLRLDYYVLPNNLAKARQHFKQVPKVLACFERYFGKYPFWRDGYALVETPYLGMEHQGAIAYGNQYMRGYLGGMIPRDMNWDYIIVHETAHEYFGNSVSCGDLAEMWIHESFATYMEALYVECAYSYRDAVRYLVGQRLYIANQEPIIGPFDVNWENWTHSDHYFKGAWMLHTLRHAINDDMKWWDLLRGFYDKHALSIATTEDFARYVNACTDEDYNAFFDQYLRYAELPTFEYELEEKGKHLKLRYRWRAGAPGFAMPILVGRADEYTRVKPTSEWQETTLHNLRAKDFRVPLEYFLIQARRR